MRKIGVLIVLIFAGKFYAQSFVSYKSLDSLKRSFSQKYKALEERLEVTERRFSEKVDSLTTRINDLAEDKVPLLENKQSIYEKNEKLLTSQLSQGKTDLSQEKDVNQKKFRYFFYAIISLIVLLIVLYLVYYMIYNKTKSLAGKTQELDNKAGIIGQQVEQLNDATAENLLKIIDQFKDIITHSKAAPIVDHTLVFEFAKQIATMENNLSRMDVDDPGIKRIRRALDKMYDSLNQVDYEVTKLMGTSVSVGKIIEIDRTELDESVQGKDRIVTNIVKCEVYYKGELIQRGRVDVKQNPNY